MKNSLFSSAAFTQHIQLNAPKYITKYTDRRGYDAIRKGSIRIGSLSKYRLQEEALSADSHEGTLDIDYVAPSGDFSGNIAGFDSVLISGANIVATESEIFDRWIFCSTLGGYNRDHHYIMANGILEYRGNSNYRYFVEFNASSFFDAIVEAALSAKPTTLADAKAHNVKYCHPPLQCSPGYNFSDDQLASLRHQNAFKKQEYFTPENEYRILFEPPYFEPYQAECPPFEVASKAIRKSITNFGTL